MHLTSCLTVASQSHLLICKSSLPTTSFQAFDLRPLDLKRPLTYSSSSEQTPLLNPNPNSNSSSTSTSEPPPPSKLTIFRSAIGINVTIPNDDGVRGGDLEAARASATGLYKQVLGLARWRSRQYVAVESLYYTALGLQILIGASLGPLSKLHSYNVTIAVLGVVNAATAGLLALLKGQGLPDRLRKDEYEMVKVRDFIEEVDGRLSVEGRNGDADADGGKEVEGLVERVWDMYNVARDTTQMNKPSSYGHQADGDGNGGGMNRGVGRRAVPTGDERVKGKFVID
ncbi:hypothetical protein LHYA1_G007204 [Lachnellula hyalina]|uniref:SMODS and SLOG-associating 2TM effector domain-containing protein n=1 Tax=Lachnellula hyalina TaxID=1316788 RepID=A0A8H8QVJ2_9HELO|nr:uncharacterized protein LHYA1_G007204 [Lachnellula hyalina]TVY23311.1 hypothetical protein LHYA1_G007204 [Lachnellula hyalina]